METLERHSKCCTVFLFPPTFFSLLSPFHSIMVAPLPHFVRNWFYGTMLVAGCQVKAIYSTVMMNWFDVHLAVVINPKYPPIYIVLWHGKQLHSIYSQLESWCFVMSFDRTLLQTWYDASCHPRSCYCSGASCKDGQQQEEQEDNLRYFIFYYKTAERRSREKESLHSNNASQNYNNYYE